MTDDESNIPQNEGQFTLYCILCLQTELTAKPAVTVVGGNAACEEHYPFFVAGDHSIEYFTSQYFKRMREQNLKGSAPS